MSAPTVTGVATADRSKPYIVPNELFDDAWSTDEEATATCFCGAVQLAFPTQGPGLVNTFVCHCLDCYKLTSSMFASNFTVRDTHLRHIRGRDNMTAWTQSKTIASGADMTNHFCRTCGTLMYRVGARFPGMSILRIGTVDDFTVQETKLRPRVEQFIKDRVSWFPGVEGAAKFEAMAPTRRLSSVGDGEVKVSSAL